MAAELFSIDDMTEPVDHHAGSRTPAMTNSSVDCPCRWAWTTAAAALIFRRTGRMRNAA
jgi:hypothetical protein